MRFIYASILVVLLLYSDIFQDATARELGEECTVTEDCTDGAAGDFGICGPENICICNQNSVPDNQNIRCLEKVNFIGDPCQINRQCTQGSLGDQSYCDLLSGQVCRCNLLTSIPNASGNKCLPIRATIGSPCEIDIQCQNGIPGFNSLCKKEDGDSDGGTCQCNEYSVTEPGQHRCLIIIRDKIGEACAANMQCTTKMGNYSECRSTKCQCIENEAIENWDGTKCLQANVPISQPCEITDQCVGYPNSVCSTSRRCDCKLHFVPSSPLDDCLAIVNELGNPCMESQQCLSGIPGYLSACIENECRCIANATSGESEHVCRVNAIYVGDRCEITAQCTINLGHSYCQGSNCVCLSEAVVSRDRMRCLLKAYLGEECTEDNQCSHVEHSVCVRDSEGNKITCQCDSGYIPDPFGTTCILENDTGKVGQPCTESSMCPGIPGISSGCSISGYCSCFPGFVQSRNLDDCLPIRNLLGDNCVQDHQCMLGTPGVYSGCLNNVCNCTSRAINVIGDNTCYPKAATVLDPCQHQEQCLSVNLGPSICLEGKCQLL